MDLKCKKLNCIYNDKYSCMAKAIDVDQNTNCTTFEPAKQLKEDQKQNVPKTMFTTTPKYHPYRHIKNAHIECNARCLFNVKGVCMSNGITVSDDKPCAKCYTYAKK